MSASNSEETELVTLRLPKRYAQVIEANLELSASPTNLRFWLAFGLVIASMPGLAAAWFFFAAARILLSGRDTATGFEIGLMGCVAVAVCAGFAWPICKQRNAYRARELI